MKRHLVSLVIGTLAAAWYLVEIPHPELNGHYAIVGGPYSYTACALRATYYNAMSVRYTYRCLEDAGLR